MTADIKLVQFHFVVVWNLFCRQCWIIWLFMSWYLHTQNCLSICSNSDNQPYTQPSSVFFFRQVELTWVASKSNKFEICCWRLLGIVFWSGVGNATVTGVMLGISGLKCYRVLGMQPWYLYFSMYCWRVLKCFVVKIRESMIFRGHQQVREEQTITTSYRLHTVCVCVVVGLEGSHSCVYGNQQF